MNREITYQAALAVAETIETHFVQHLREARARGEKGLAPEPHAKVIAAMIDTAFWASLRKEEGHSPKISLAFLPPEKAQRPLVFEQRLPLSSFILTKLAPGVERAGIHLGVWYEGENLYIWGTMHEITNFCFVLDVSEPGLLVIKHRRLGGFGKFNNVAVLKGDQVKVVDETSASLPDCPAVLSSLLGFAAASSWNDSVNVLVQMAVSMRAHGRGGTLLVVPSGKEDWRGSIMHPIQYAIAPAFSELADLMRQDVSVRSRSKWQTALVQAIDNIAGLTAIDGATVITDQYELLAFGAKIVRATDSAQVEEMTFTEPVIGGEAMVVSPSQSGGTRHLSAAQFVYDQQDALALVASQDGRFTIFSWSPCENRVHAHRVDALLL
ncbi:putative sensor domain DACNV-containing protein [Nibribacter koreensis]|uniref:Probable sensor domain-containing protein n=1 Tax=Nibribacter koreensis TaxID=1084519 RepID=A0ABP8FQA7_9BACT